MYARKAAGAIIILALIGGGALAQHSGGSAAQHSGSQMPAGDKDYLPAMDKMHKDMMAAVDPDPTKTWVKMMIPHHQGAIDMSKAVLKQTKDAKIRAMAEKIVQDQSREIKEMRDWLKKNGG
jgi:uncharacterized protein (DUF305 family)